jgi:predicted PurR-regulated permease PerM
MKNFSQWSVRLRIIVLVVLLVLIAATLWFTRSILQPLIIAGFIAYLINPAVNLLTRRTRMTRRSSVILVYFVTLLVLIGTPATVTSLLLDEFTGIVTDLLNQFNRLIALLQNPIAIPGIPINLSQLANQLSQFRTTFLSSYQTRP